jgi:putative transferase (TIGR04331 family)
LPLRKLLKLYFGLSQIPFLSLPIVKINVSKMDDGLRNSLRINSNAIGFEGLIKNLLPVLMPKVYVEDFLDVRIKVLTKYPSKPKSIFTANLYQADDAFKIWAAEKVAEGVPLILGQHGGTFAIARHNQTVDHQLRIADNFVTWGWDKSMEDHAIKLPSMQLCDRKKIVPEKEGNILLIETALPRYFYCHYAVPVAGQFLYYLQDQLDFINELKPVILNNLNIRLDPSMLSRGWDLHGVFDKAGHLNKVDKSKQTLNQAIKKSRICVCTSNSTVFLETLSLNFPTVVFWDSDYNEISPEAEPYIDILVKAEILFFSAIQAANHINKLNSNVNDWWFSTKVQLAREIFCQHYALTSPDWLDAWRKLLSNNQKIY